MYLTELQHYGDVTIAWMQKEYSLIYINLNIAPPASHDIFQQAPGQLGHQDLLGTERGELAKSHQTIIILGYYRMVKPDIYFQIRKLRIFVFLQNTPIKVKYIYSISTFKNKTTGPNHDLVDLCFYLIFFLSQEVSFFFVPRACVFLGFVPRGF